MSVVVLVAALVGADSTVINTLVADWVVGWVFD